MITVDQFMDTKTRLANKQSLRNIAWDTGHSRNTIRKIARGEHSLQGLSENKPRKPRAHKIDPFCDYIRKQVSEYNLSSERILPESQVMGYQGSIHSLRRFVASIKAESQRLAAAVGSVVSIVGSSSPLIGRPRWRVACRLRRRLG
jgi:hypothetical protein